MTEIENFQMLLIFARKCLLAFFGKADFVQEPQTWQLRSLLLFFSVSFIQTQTAIVGAEALRKCEEIMKDESRRIVITGVAGNEKISKTNAERKSNLNCFSLQSRDFFSSLPLHGLLVSAVYRMVMSHG